MRYLTSFAACVVAVALHGSAWAQPIYETKDAQGNPDFTDSPAGANAEEIDLPETNLINPPQPEQQAQPQSAPTAAEQAPVQENNTEIINNGNDNGGYDDGDDDDDGVYDDDLARQREIERRNGLAPGEVGNPQYEMPHEVGDTNAQMPHEVGDSNAQMPHEVGDSSAQMPAEVGDSPGVNEAGRQARGR